ncbi:MAG: hypothetical protein JWM57_1238 [Phycisphaerales bacterium]|nr:hypothetical protein [Phycisphaerales bacterium]
MTDRIALHQFRTAAATSEREHAFAEIVRRHAAWLYNAALRQVNDPAAAEEATQATFIVLARKAGKLRDDTLLTAWLAAVLRLAVLRVKRDHARRIHHETQAAMNQAKDLSAGHASLAVDPVTAAAWRDLAPMLDDAVASLSPADREAILLRFYRQLTYVEIGDALHLSEDAARKRVDRAVEKLRGTLNRRGVLCGVSAVALAVVLSANASAIAAPPGLIATATTFALAGPAAAAASGTAAGLAHGIATGTTMSFVKVIATIAAVLALIGGVAVVAMPSHPLAQPASNPALLPPPPAAAGSITGTVRSGVRIELLGVAESPSTGGPVPHPWFDMAGHPLPKPPYAKPGQTYVPPGPGRVRNEYAVAFHGSEGINYKTILIAKRPGGPTTRQEPSVLQAVAGDEANRAIEALRSITVEQEARQAPPLYFRIAAGAWQARLTSRPEATASIPPEQDLPADTFGIPFEDGGAAVLHTEQRAAGPAHFPDFDRRLVAIDTAGNIHFPEWRPQPYLSAADRKLFPVLDTLAPELAVGALDFESAVGFMRDAAPVPIEVDWKAIEAAGYDRHAKVTLTTKDGTVADAIIDLVRQASGKKWLLYLRTTSDGVVIYPPEQLGDSLAGVFYAPDLPLSQLARFEIQTRPFDEWIEFQNATDTPGVGRPVTVRTSDDVIAKAAFSDGVTTELVAIGDAAKGTWWTPDGRPTQKPQGVNIPLIPNTQDGTEVVPKRGVVFVTVTRGGKGPVSSRGRPDPYPSGTGLVTARRPTGDVAQEISILRIPEDVYTVNWRTQIAAGAPQSVTLQKGSGRGWMPDASTTLTSPGGTTYTLGRPLQQGDRATFAAWPCDPQSPDSLDFKFLSPGGEDLTANQPVDDQHGGTSLSVWSQAKPLEDITGVRMTLTRFDRWANFQGVSLHAGIASDVHVTTSDPASAVAEAGRVVEEFLECLATKQPEKASLRFAEAYRTAHPQGAEALLRQIDFMKVIGQAQVKLIDETRAVAVTRQFEIKGRPSFLGLSLVHEKDGWLIRDMDMIDGESARDAYFAKAGGVR